MEQWNNGKEGEKTGLITSAYTNISIICNVSTSSTSRPSYNNVRHISSTVPHIYI